MIIYKINKCFETRSDKPKENWTDNKNVYIVEDETELAKKIINAYPFYNFITNEQEELIDIEILEDPTKLNKLKAEKIVQTKQQLFNYLQNSPLQFVDGKLYSVTADKQTLLANALQVYQMKVQTGLPATLKWNATGEECIEWTVENLSMLALAIANYVEPLVAKQQALEVKIRNANTLEAIEQIEINYETV